MSSKILVVDDEFSICELLKINLESEGYEVILSHDGKDAMKKIENLKPDLMILDIMLPEINGFEICKKTIANNPIPIIMLTAKSDLVDKVLGLELGADDYITKPFHTRELLARVKALLRRSLSQNNSSSSEVIRNGELEINHENRKATISDNEIELSAKEYDLLYYLMKNLDKVFSREVLLENVWEYEFAGDTRTVDVHIQKLRKKIKDYNVKSEYIQTVFGVGYKMKKID